MKHLFRIILTVIAAIVAVSCMDEIENPQSPDQQEGELVEMTFKASFADTKTTLVDGVNVWWMPGDKIAVSGAADPFVSTLTQMQPKAEFVGETVQSQKYFAIYPHSALKSFDENTAVVSLSLIQKPELNTFPNEFNLSAASLFYCSDLSFTFHNMLGYVKFTIDESIDNVCAVKLKSNSTYTWGKELTVNFATSIPFISHISSEPCNSILQSEEPFQPGTYYIALLPGSYYDGMSFIFVDEEGKEAVLTIKGEASVNAGEIKNIGTISDLKFEDSPEMREAKQKEALVSIYNAAGGDGWVNKENWCSDMPLEQWQGVTVENGAVTGLWLMGNNMTGSLSSEIGKLTELQQLRLSGNKLSGEIPSELWSLSKLVFLDLSDNNLSGVIPSSIGNMTELIGLNLARMDLSGSIPEEICNCHKLSTLILDSSNLSGMIPSGIGSLSNLTWLDLSRNELVGGIPESISRIMTDDLEFLVLNYNKLTGTVPLSVQNNSRFNDFWTTITYQEGDTPLDFDEVQLNAPSFNIRDINGQTHSISDIYADNVYTLLLGWSPYCAYSLLYLDDLKKWYEDYKEYGFEVVAWNAGTPFPEDVKPVIDQYGIEWINFQPEQLEGEYNYLDNFTVPFYPFVTVVDNKGKIVLNPIMDDRSNVLTMLKETFGDTRYTSEDYSRDGFVDVLQLKEGVPGGIDIVLMGDGYSDRLIDDGTYQSDINKVMEAFFSVEPYKSHRKYFNVYSVDVVSANEVFEDGSSTALESYFGDGTLVGGNDSKCLEYARKAIGDDRMDEALILVAVNSNRYAGTCYMYSSSDPESGDYGSGVSVSYFPSVSDKSLLENFVHHEAGGHGFAKLGDEYCYDENPEISADMVSSYRLQEPYGWWRNVDFTSDYTKVKWYRFIEDSRYADEGVGLFQGALTYMRGAYRPTEDSIMNSGNGCFNAPSREAIYYRLHKLAYGPEWEYDYDKFVEYDAVNRATASQTVSVQKRRANYVEKTYEPTHPPVVINGSWRDAVK